MTKYLETKRNSIEEAISSVVLGENVSSKRRQLVKFQKTINQDEDEAKDMTK